MRGKQHGEGGKQRTGEGMIQQQQGVKCPDTLTPGRHPSHRTA